VQPLLGGVHAGSVDRISARSTVPDVLELARGNRSLVLGLRRRRRAAPRPTAPPAPPLVSLHGGLGRLTRGLVEAIGAARVLTGAPATAVRPGPAGWEVVGPGVRVVARQVVLATPEYAAAELLAETAPELARELRGIPYVDVATVTLALPRAEVGDLVGTGFLVPPAEGSVLVGCTWLTSKWPQLANPDTVLLRCMVGRDGDDRFALMGDDELVDAVRADLERVMGLSAAPTGVLVQRWPRAIPQYVVGHADRLERVDRLVPPGLHVTGAAYRGSGLAACGAAARRTATVVAGTLETTATPENLSHPISEGAAP
jgi:oxygen-dependent protoporphyrinogen oxidase